MSDGDRDKWVSTDKYDALETELATARAERDRLEWVLRAMPCYLTFRAHGSPLTCDRHEQLNTRPRAEPCPRCAALATLSPGEGSGDG